MKLKYPIIGHLFFLFSFILSVLYYKERIIHIDSAHYMFSMIQSESFYIGGRFGDIFSQILPWLAIKAGLPLRIILISYSVSFILIFYLIYLFCIYGLKNISAGMSLVLVLCLCTSGTFYYAVTEVHQGLVFSVFFFALISYSDIGNIRRNILIRTLAVFTVVICYYLHPTTFFMLLFSVIFLMIDLRIFTNKFYLSMIILVIFLFLLRLFITPENAPEGREYSAIRNFSEYLSRFWHLGPLGFLRVNSGQNTFVYVIAEIVLSTVVIFYIFTKQFLKLTFVLLTIGFFITVNTFVYAEGNSGLVLEKSFLPLSFFIAIPFTHDVLFRIKFNQNIVFIFLLTIIIFRTRDISRSSRGYRNRIHYMSELCREMRETGGKKFFIKRENLNLDKISITWALPTETMLLSSIPSPDSCITIYGYENGYIPLALATNQVYISGFTAPLEESSKLNSTYFHIASGIGYQVIDREVR